MEEEIRIGDQVQVKGTPLEFKVEGFTYISGQRMAQSKYGDFNVDLLEKVKTEFDSKEK